MAQSQNEPVIVAPSLPKGGGAMQSIGKGWSAVGVKGEARYTIPVPASAGRGFAPTLALGYSSQGGRTPFGQGWYLSMPTIGLRTTKGVPAYDGEDELVDPSGDVLVPERDGAGQLAITQVSEFRGISLGKTYEVLRYIPRVENTHARIESWRSGEDWFWLLHDPDGTVHVYGKGVRTQSVVNGATRIAQWWLEESVAANGEKICYEYVQEDGQGIPETGRERDHSTAWYLRRVLYGNDIGNLEPDSLSGANSAWHFEAVFDYGERDTSLTGVPSYAPVRTWPCRQDPYSAYEFGFEVRTWRLCRQVLVFHRFAELGAAPALVSRLLFEYHESARITHLVAAHQIAVNATGEQEFMPPAEFRYSAPLPVDEASWAPFQALPAIDEAQGYQLVDLYGEGLPGMLYRDGQGWYYREPLADADAGVKYGPPQLLPHVPPSRADQPIAHTLMDMTGDGKLDWLVAQPGMAGFFTLEPDGSWRGFVPYAAFPSEFHRQDGYLADISGDGLADFAMIGPKSVRWYRNAREVGFRTPLEVAHDDDRLPVGGDGRQVLIGFSDMLGSGQQHLVRITHDAVSVWPNLGRGAFGKRLDFAALPFQPEEFDAARIRLADLDGSGAADLIYLQADGAWVFHNESGNTLSGPTKLPWPEDISFDQLCQVTAADLHGQGCSSLILTVPYLRPKHWHCKLVGTNRPYLIVEDTNNMGAWSQVHYRSSALEWLDEKAERRASSQEAVCHMPFPLQLVARTEQFDAITGHKLTQRNQYRQGFYDGVEREFRGFGLLLQYDTATEPTDGAPQEDYTAPALSKTWFHVGRAANSDGFDRSDPHAVSLGNTLFSGFDAATGHDDLSVSWDEETVRQMLRALSGMPRRTEVFGLDDIAAAPYSVTEHRYLVRMLRPTGATQPYAVVQPLMVESVTRHYERLSTDPRIQHQLTLKWDQFGVPLHAAAVSYARRRTDPPFDSSDAYALQCWHDAFDDAQWQFYIQEQRGEAIHLTEPQWWRLGLPYRSRSNAIVLEERQLDPARISYEQWIAEGSPIGPNAARQLTGLVLQRYQGAPVGQANFAALPDYVESAELDEPALAAYEKVLTPEELIAKLSEAGYRTMPVFLPDGNESVWTVCRDFATFAPLANFYRATEYYPAKGVGSTVAAYDPYWLFPIKVTAPDGCATTVQYNYRQLQPVRIVGPNQSVQEAKFDGFGRPIATSFYGKESDTPVGFAPISDYQPKVTLPDDALADPAVALQDAATAHFYAPFAWMGTLPAELVRQNPQWIEGRYLMPNGAVRASVAWRAASEEGPDAALMDAVTHRPPHAATLQADRYPGDPAKQIRCAVIDGDGFGRTLQQKARVEPGLAYQVTDDGQLELVDGKPVEAHTEQRWLVSERVEYNNKGWPVRIYRPYFATAHRYIRDEAVRKVLPCDRQHYDPLGRPTVTLTAAGWMRRQIYWPWYTIAEDENDTAEEALSTRQPQT